MNFKNVGINLKVFSGIATAAIPGGKEALRIRADEERAHITLLTVTRPQDVKDVMEEVSRREELFARHDVESMSLPIGSPRSRAYQSLTDDLMSARWT